MADPGLALAISSGSARPVLAWIALLPLIAQFWELVCSRLDAHSRAGRLKQWLNFLRRRYPEAELAYQALKTVNDPAAISRWLAITLEKQGLESGIGLESFIPVAQPCRAGQGLFTH